MNRRSSCIVLMGVLLMGGLGCTQREAGSGQVGGSTDLPEPPARVEGRGGGASAEDVKALEPVVAELARRAAAGERGYFARLMKEPSDSAVDDMIARVKRVDLPGTYARHVVLAEAGGRLDYHEPAHFQVELAKAEGKWGVGRLWFCR